MIASEALQKGRYRVLRSDVAWLLPGLSVLVAMLATVAMLRLVLRGDLLTGLVFGGVFLLQATLTLIYCHQHGHSVSAEDGEV